jgi:hypothetical protein
MYVTVTTRSKSYRRPAKQRDAKKETWYVSNEIINLTAYMEVWIRFNWFRIRSSGGTCECGNGPSSSIKGGK